MTYEKASLRARQFVEDYIKHNGMVPNPDWLKKAVTTLLIQETSSEVAALYNRIDFDTSSKITALYNRVDFLQAALLSVPSFVERREMATGGKDMDKNFSEAQIKHMVDRFLGWKLPKNFVPDGGISFKATYNEHTDHPTRHEPSGTNLFDALQADAMVRYLIECLPSS